MGGAVEARAWGGLALDEVRRRGRWRGFAREFGIATGEETKDTWIGMSRRTLTQGSAAWRRGGHRALKKRRRRSRRTAPSRLASDSSRPFGSSLATSGGSTTCLRKGMGSDLRRSSGRGQPTLRPHALRRGSGAAQVRASLRSRWKAMIKVGRPSMIGLKVTKFPERPHVPDVGVGDGAN